MPYNPGIQDRRGEYMIEGAQALGRGIQTAGSALGQYRQEWKKQSQDRDRMTGFLESMGAFDDPEFAQKFASAPYGKQQGMFGKAMLDFEAQREMEQAAMRMANEKHMTEWAANFKQRYNQLDPELQQTTTGMVTDYLTGVANGLEVGPQFATKLATLPTKAQAVVMDGISKGMELYDMSRPRDTRPQYEEAPNGQIIMVNPKTNSMVPLRQPEPPAAPPSYGTMPAPPPGQVGILNDGKGGIRVIPGAAPGPIDATKQIMGGSAGFDEEMPYSTAEEADARLRSMNKLFGE